MLPPSAKAWRPALLRSPLRAGVATWLFDRGSLTARLRARGSFALTVLAQDIARPMHDEAPTLKLRRRQVARRREVVLSCDDQPVVFAHSVLPLQPRGAMAVWLDRLGNRSLGALLFSRPGFARGRIFCRRIDHRHALYQPAMVALRLDPALTRHLWARRSLFVTNGQSVLVTEVFSPKLYAESDKP